MAQDPPIHSVTEKSASSKGRGARGGILYLPSLAINTLRNRVARLGSLVSERLRTSHILKRSLNRGWTLNTRFLKLSFHFASTGRRSIAFNAGVQFKLANGVGRKKGNLLSKPGESISPARTYDIFCLPIIDWNFRFQRPQQLLSRFASRGHRVFYVGTEFHTSGSGILFDAISDRIYGLQLPGPEDLNLYQDAILMTLFSTGHARSTTFAAKSEPGMWSALFSFLSGLHWLPMRKRNGVGG